GGWSAGPCARTSGPSWSSTPCAWRCGVGGLAPGWCITPTRAASTPASRWGGRSAEPASPSRWAQWATPMTNALAESFISTLKTELRDRRSWPTRQEARTAIYDYIEGFYNPRRRHSALGYLSPAEFERRHCPEAVSAA